jgi:pimeloyl-ACP methyl ester carboxylesterase
VPDLQPDQQGVLTLDGHDIHWEYFGRGDREAFCLLNGLAMHTKAWYGFVPRLQPDFDVLLYDYPGQGQSSARDVSYSIPAIASYLTSILDHLSIARVHVMGVSYGGFIALDFARLFQPRLHTLTLSGILLSHETLFDMYQDLSLRFYEGGEPLFDLYTRYMYEKIFGEEFAAAAREAMEQMRQRFKERYAERIHSLIRLTEAQNPFFASLERNLAGYRAIQTPTLVMPGAQDRVIPVWVQQKLLAILPNAIWQPIAGSGHVVYLEKPDAFFDNLTRFARARELAV